MIVVTVARRPPQQASVAANILSHGCGGINVDATRVASTDTAPKGSGRWPANLILEHRATCQLTGSQDVKGAGFELSRPPRSTGRVFGTHRATDNRIPPRVNAQGFETVDAWSCVVGCPCTSMVTDNEPVARFFKQVGGMKG